MRESEDVMRSVDAPGWAQSTAAVGIPGRPRDHGQAASPSAVCAGIRAVLRPVVFLGVSAPVVT